MIRYRPEELDQRLTFNSIQLVKDEGGGHEKTFVENFTCWGKVKSKSGRENNDADMLEASGNYTFVIRWRNDFDETNQIVWNGQAYNIKFISEMGGRKMYLEISAERGVAQ